MLKLNKKNKQTNLEVEIDRVLDEMNKVLDGGIIVEQEVLDKDGNLLSTYNAVDPSYVELNKELERLYKMKEIDVKAKVSPNTIWTVCGSTLTVLGILIFEKTDILTTKALQFVVRGRV